MKRKIIATIFIVFITTFCNSQEKDSNSIFYSDFIIGSSTINGGSFNAGISLNYQNKKDLFSLKLNSSLDQNDATLFNVIFPLATFFTAGVVSKEYSFLYGKRFVKDSFSYSFSIGTSYLVYYDLSGHFFGPLSINRENLLGVPVEFTMHWFDSKKERIKALGLFPIGKPTGFGISSGFKIYGTIAKKSYIGAGLIFGFGYYKRN